MGTFPFQTGYATASSVSVTLSDPQSSAVTSIASEVERLGLAIQNAEERLRAVLAPAFPEPAGSPETVSGPMSEIRAVQDLLSAQVNRLNLLISRVEA